MSEAWVIHVSEAGSVSGVAAPLPINNLDTDQIMPKQFLRGIDKSGLDKGLLYDLRFDGENGARTDFVLNRPGYARCRILVAGENFGCGSSREHAVWGLVQYGINAVVAPSFGDIFYSNALNNKLLLAVVSSADLELFLNDISKPARNRMTINASDLTVCSAGHRASFPLSPRYRRMFMENLDLLEASLAHRSAIASFEQQHWREQPWLRAIGSKTGRTRRY